ncbi:class I SAM-dependent methyltransferase [Urbifossiella limnaea]|nr:class I SAM-dependent methyltransferase [Urbifossiella limnaea]
MFAHRPEVRAAWGGDPAGCVPPVDFRPDMPAAALAELLTEPPYVMPDGWKLWPVAREAHLILAERFLAEMPAYPEGRFAGRGAVICGGGRYEASVYVACRMLREVGWRHPIQVWHRGPAEPVSDRVRQLPGVEVVDAESHPARAARRLLGGWEVKTLAVLNSPFEEVLFLDADCYPIYDPNECFEPEHNPHGIVTWPDNPIGDECVHWPSYGVAPDDGYALNGGHYVYAKRAAWRVLQLAGHYDDHSDYYYWRSVTGVAVGGFGDQEQVRAALHRLGAPHHRYTRRPLACRHGSYIQAGPHGRPLFVHRFFNKFAPAGDFALPPQWHPGSNPMELVAWRYFLDWMSAAGAADPADEVPGWFTTAECRLWAEACRGRDVLELGRHLGRSTTVAAVTAKRVVSLDRADDGPADFWLQRYGVRHKVWLRVGTFAALGPSSGGPFTACLIDGAHDRDNVAADIANVVPHLAPGAVVGFHDHDDPNFPGVAEAVAEAVAAHGWKPAGRADFLALFETPR